MPVMAVIWAGIASWLLQAIEGVEHAGDMPVLAVFQISACRVR